MDVFSLSHWNVRYWVFNYRQELYLVGTSKVGRMCSKVGRMCSNMHRQYLIIPKETCIHTVCCAARVGRVGLNVMQRYIFPEITDQRNHQPTFQLRVNQRSLTTTVTVIAGGAK